MERAYGIVGVRGVDGRRAHDPHDKDRRGGQEDEGGDIPLPCEHAAYRPTSARARAK
jgi:hypothetical protein